jgi:hypothetical protein
MYYTQNTFGRLDNETQSLKYIILIQLEIHV